MSLPAARAAAQDMLRHLEQGTNPNAAQQKGLTVRRAVEAYIEAATDLQPRSIQGYRYALENYLTPLADVPLSHVGKHPALVQKLFLDLSKNGHRATANGAMRTLSAAYNGARELHPDLPPNPVRRGVVRLHRLARRTVRIPEDGFQAWGEMLMTVENPVRRALRLFLLLTGQRDTATQEMRWADVELKPGHETIFFPSPKGGPRRAFNLPLSPAAVRVLEFVRTAAAPEYLDSPWVWPAKSESGHVEETKDQRRKGLLTAHPLRRTFISVGYEVAPSKMVSYIANHACKDNITDSYFEPSGEAVRRALVAIDDELLRLLNVPLESLLAGSARPAQKTITQIEAELRESPVVSIERIKRPA
jgi:integrase